SAMRLALTKSAVSFVRATAAIPGRESCTWTNKTGATDLVFDPHNPDILFAAMYEVRRTAYSMISGGPGSGLYKSTDGGSTWKRLEGHGLPSGVLGRIGVAVSGADSRRVYAMVEARENAIYRSNAGGQSWQMTSKDPR